MALRMLTTFTGIIFLGCGNSKQSIKDLGYYSDTGRFFMDTIYKKVNLEGQNYSIWVLRDNYDTNNVRYDRTIEDGFNIRSIYNSPVTVLFINPKKEIELIKHFGLYCPVFFKPSGKGIESQGKLLYKRNFGAGGSGFREQMSLVFLQDKKVETNDILETGELDYLLFKTDEKQILVLNGIWDMEAREGHFENHRFEVNNYELNYQNYLDKVFICTTNSKYVCPDFGNANHTLFEMKFNEGECLKDINVFDYYKIQGY